MAYNVRTPEQAQELISQIMSSQFLDEFAKKNETKRVMDALDYATKAGSQNFIKVDVDHTLALFERIKIDKEKPASFYKIVTVFNYLALYSDEFGAVKLSLDELSRELETHKNNIRPIINYLRKLGVILPPPNGGAEASSRKKSSPKLSSRYYGKY